MSKIPFAGTEFPEENPLACLQMTCMYYGRDIPIKKLKSILPDKTSYTLTDLSKIAKELGFNASRKKAALDELPVDLPVIVQLVNKKMLLVERITRRKVIAIYPEYGRIAYRKKAFLNLFSEAEEQTGTCLFLHPGDEFEVKSKNYAGKVDRTYKVTIPVLEKRIRTLQVISVIMLTALIVGFIKYTTITSEQRIKTQALKHTLVLGENNLNNFIVEATRLLETDSLLQAGQVEPLKHINDTHMYNQYLVGKYYYSVFGDFVSLDTGFDSTFIEFETVHEALADKVLFERF
jgi:hypothetical protein